MLELDNTADGFTKVIRPLLGPLLFLDFDDVICLNTAAGGYDAMLAMGRVEQGAALAEYADLWRVLFERSACAHLQALDAEFSPIYVLSTSWTRFFDKSAIASVLRACGLGFVADHLHPDAWETPKNTGARLRSEEISQWLATHRCSGATGQAPWVILDDGYSGTGLSDWPDSSQRNFIVLCQQGVGLTEVEYQHLRRAFMGRMNIANLPVGECFADDRLTAKEP